jgi:HAMP domain-containing protein
MTTVSGAIASAQGLDGYVSIMVDAFPSVDVAVGNSAASSRQGVGELRTRALLERRFDVGSRVRLTAAGFVEGLVAERGGTHTVTAASVRPQEVHAEFLWAKGDLRIGVGRLAWGRLDEFQPTDVVNPIDAGRFFLEGRAESRLPVGLVRGRVIPSERFSLEGIYVPFFRRGRFDQLDEASSPFNLIGRALPAAREPASAWHHAQGGVRANVTTGRVDWSLTSYRGFEPLPVYQLAAPVAASTPPALVGGFPRFTMLGGDFETVRGEWGVRGEVAAFVERTLQAPTQPLAAAGHSFEAGVGVDRRAGQHRVAANFVLARRTSEALDLRDTDTLMVLSLDRSFARETRRLRTFAVYNPADGSAFARAIAAFDLRDAVTLETSGGWFTGDGSDALGRLATRDFLYARLKVSF